MGSSSSAEGQPINSGSQDGASRSRRPGQVIVRLNVYSPSGGQHAVYHSGVEVLGAEYVFGGGDTSHSGVTAQRPRVPPSGSGWIFYQTVEIGPSIIPQDHILNVVRTVREDFPANSYDLVSNNCNHFSETMCRRLTGLGIPSWVNRLAGLGNAVRSVVGAAPKAAPSASRATEGLGGPAASGLVARPVENNLQSEVDWPKVGVLNAEQQDTSEALKSGGVLSSALDGSSELLLLIPFQGPVKMRAVRVEAPDVTRAPQRIRLFANQRNLDMDDAAGKAPATQEFEELDWKISQGLDSTVVGTTLELNFLRFQNLGFVAIYVGMEEGDSSRPIAIQNLQLLTKL